MQDLTCLFAVWLVPGFFAGACYLFATNHLGHEAGVSAAVTLVLFGALAWAGHQRHRSLWQWARHRIVTGQDAGRFVGELLFLLGAPPLTFVFCCWAFGPLELESPMLASLFTAAVVFVVVLFSFSREYVPFVRGTRVWTLAEARSLAEAKLPSGDQGFFFCGCQLASVVALMHFLLIGAVGAGKTKIVEALLKFFLSSFKRFDARALVFDAKREFYGYVDSLGLGTRVVIMDPTDARCFSWAMSKDVVDEDDAKTLAEIFVEKNERASQPFFDDAARELCQAVVEALIRKKPGQWGLRDIVYAMRSDKRIKALVRDTEEGRDLIRLYFSKEKTAQDVMSTVATKIGRFKTVAKAWDRAEREGRTVSIDEWMRGNFVILMGSSHKAAATVRDLNHLFFKRLTQVILDEPDNDQAQLLSPKSRRHYLFLDEVRYAGKLDGLNELFVKARSKGAVLVVTVQDRKGMQAVYGEQIADEQLSQAATIAILRLQNPDTASWASKLIGQCELLQRSHTAGEDGRDSDNARLEVKDAVLPSEILRLPLADAEHGLSGYFLSPTLGVWQGPVPWDEVMAARRPQRKAAVENYVRRPSDPHEQLRPWDDQELGDLGISRADLQGEHEVEGPEEKPTPEEEAELLERLNQARLDGGLVN
jgi:hypothetical protein